MWLALFVVEVVLLFFAGVVFVEGDFVVVFLDGVVVVFLVVVFLEGVVPFEVVFFVVSFFLSVFFVVFLEVVGFLGVLSSAARC